MSFHNHKPYSLRDFLSPVWRYSLRDKYSDNENVNFNYLILKAIDRQLSQVEDKTIMSKAELYLKSATSSYLDYFGSWFGLERLGKHESDKHYRKRILNHVKHPRATIPALKRAISSYLHNHMSDVHIYEPWRDVFLSNDYASRTNGRAHFNGEYYRTAIINICIDTHFDESVVDMINWFRPVGVVFLMTYENGPHADVWKLHETLFPVWHYDTINSFIGFDTEECHDLNFLDQVSMYGHDPFYVSGLGTSDSVLFNPDYHSGVHYEHYLPLSLLNSKDVLIDPVYYNKPYYSFISTAHNLVKAKFTDTINNLLLHSKVVDPSIYPDINKKQGLAITVDNKPHHSNLLSFTYNLHNWKRFHHTYLSGLSDKGRAVVSMNKNGSTLKYAFNNLEGQIPAKNKVGLHNLVKAGKSYQLSFDIMSSNQDNKVQFKVVLDGQVTSITAQVKKNKWTKITTRLSPSDTAKSISFILSNRPENTGKVYFSSPCLSQYVKAWEPSYQDIQYPTANYKYQYNYVFFNIQKYYYKNIESQHSVYQKLSPAYGVTPTSDQVNQYISKQFNHKSLTFTYLPALYRSIITQLKIRNFNSGRWENYATHLQVLGNQSDTYNMKFNDVSPYINKNGILAIALKVPTFGNAYNLLFTYLGMRFCHYYANKPSIHMYNADNKIKLWWHINTWHIFKWTDTETYDNRSREQNYFPIRYIRNYVRNVSFGGTNNDLFITNNSVLNGHKLIADYQDLTSKPDLYIKPYWDYNVIPSLTDNGNPVKSVSIMGVSCGDNYPTNRLNNLLKNSVFGYFSHPIWGHSKLTYMKKDINSEHVWFNNTGSKLWTSTDSIGSRNHYVLTFNARTRSQNVTIMVKIELKSNDFVKTLTKNIQITPQRHVYDIEFNTYGVFPDTVRFVWEYVGNEVERFKNLKHYKDTFTELKKNHYTFGYLLSHIIPQADEQNLADHPKPVNTFNIRPSDVYMPSEPAYTYDGSVKKVPAPTTDNKDIDDGWNFNGILPDSYYPAIFSKDGKICCGYTPKSYVDNLSNSDKYLALVYDNKGDYALGYNFYGDINGYQYGYLENVHSGKFVKVYGPAKAIFQIMPNVDTSEVMFRDISCHLLTRVTVDGKDTAQLAPQVNFKGQNAVAYNDIILGQAMNKYDLGENYGDLSRYHNTYDELKDYGINYQYLLNNTLVNDSNLTWQNFNKNGTTWQDAQNQDWSWLPLISRENEDYQIPKDTLTYADLLNANSSETFANLKQSKDLFRNLKTGHITFEELLGHKANIPYYSFNYARDNNWVFADGEPFDNKEHCVTIDLGRVYTNIDHILLQHGSDSVNNAVYDSCVQTSMDGKHWHTWYDNYKGYKYPLDKPYVEPKAAPVAIPVDKYDVVNSANDYQDDIKIPKLNYISANLVHYPVKTLSSLLFNDDRKVIKLHAHDYYSTDVNQFNDFPNLVALNAYKLNHYLTKAGHIGMTIVPAKTANSNNTDAVNFMGYLDNNNNTSSNYYYPHVPYFSNDVFTKPKVASDNTVNYLFSGISPKVSLLDDNQSTIPMDIKTHQLYHHILLLNNDNTSLNSNYVLQNGWTIPQVNQNNSSHNKNNNPVIPIYYDAQLIRFNLAGLVHREFPNLSNNAKEYGIANSDIFVQNMVSHCSAISLTVTVTASVNSWYLSLWNYKFQKWDKTKISHLNGPMTLHISSFTNYIDKNGTVDALVYTVKHANSKPTFAVQNIDCSLELDLFKVDNFDGGMYPHYNYEYNTNKLYRIKPSTSQQVISMPWIYKKALGHKVTVSFNLVSSTQGNEFDLKIGKLQTGMIKAEKGYQSFRFIFDIPGRFKGHRRKNLTPQLVLPYNLGNIDVYGFKAQIGVTDSPYTFPRNSKDYNYIING